MGSITTCPQEIDAIAKRAWKRMYDAVASNLQATVANFSRIFAYFMLHQPAYQVQEVTAERVYDSFNHTA